MMKRPKLTQKEIVLKMLEVGGDKGVHSFSFIQARIPRVAARICELRAEGYEITSKRELLHGSAEGVRYQLIGSSAEQIPATAHASAGRPAGKAHGVAGQELADKTVDSDSGCQPELFPETPYEHMEDAS